MNSFPLEKLEKFINEVWTFQTNKLSILFCYCGNQHKINEGWKGLQTANVVLVQFCRQIGFEIELKVTIQ